MYRPWAAKLPDNARREGQRPTGVSARYAASVRGIGDPPGPNHSTNPFQHHRGLHVRQHVRPGHAAVESPAQKDHGDARPNEHSERTGRAAKPGLTFIAACDPEAFTLYRNSQDVDLYMTLLDPTYVNLCPGTAQFTVAGSDPVAIAERHKDRVVLTHWRTPPDRRQGTSTFVGTVLAVKRHR